MQKERFKTISDAFADTQIWWFKQKKTGAATDNQKASFYLKQEEYEYAKALYEINHW